MKHLKYFENNNENVDLIKSIKSNDYKSFIYHLKNSNDINYKINSSLAYTPLMQAVISDREIMVRVLLKYGADVNIEQSFGNTALNYSHNQKITKMLIDAGADIDHLNRNDSSALMCMGNNVDIICILIESGANWNFISKLDKIDFFEFLKPSNQKIIMNKYPDKYKEYLIKKESNKYNL